MKKILEAVSPPSKSQYVVSKPIIPSQLERPSRLIRFPEIKARVGLCRSTIYTRIKKGTFPAPIRLGERSVAWLEADIDAWIQERISTATKEVSV